MAIMMLGFKILVNETFNRQQLSISYRDKEKSYPNEVVKLINRIWLQKVSSGIRLFDGKLFEVLSYRVKDQVLFLELQNTSYKYFVGTGDHEFISTFGGKETANPLSVGAVVVTSDNYFVVGKRRNNLYFNLGKYSIIAGTMDREKDFTDGKPDPFGAILRELMEEKGVNQNNVREILCLGLIYNVDYNQTYLPFSIVLGVSSEALMNSLPQEDEFENFIYVKVGKESLFNFLAENCDLISQTSMGNILLFGRKVFGETWLRNASGRLRIDYDCIEAK
jgi:8-oxo-dGTP pyrophosphatase MutT (NUDIX family)